MNKPRILGTDLCENPGKQEKAQGQHSFILKAYYIPSTSYEKFKQISSFSTY